LSLLDMEHLMFIYLLPKEDLGAIQFQFIHRESAITAPLGTTMLLISFTR
jgi:hypothetical protein